MSERRFPLISDEALARLRVLVGKEIRRPQPYIETATRDAIRHWADGIGDRNPWWLASGTAPPTILFAMDRIVSGYVTGLPGIHAMYAGTDFRWRRAIREGERLVGRSVLLDLEEKPSTFARRAIKQTYRTTFVDEVGATVAEVDSWCFRTERDAAREEKKYARVEPHRYAHEEIERIRDAYRREEIRGGAPRYVEDVAVGAAIPEVVKGPLTVTSVIAFVQGWGSLYVRAHGLAFDLFDRRAAGARPLGRGSRARRRSPGGVRLRARAGRLARPPRHQLDGRRGHARTPQRPGPAPQPHRRYDVVSRADRGEVGRAWRGDARPRGRQPARRGDRPGPGGRNLAAARPIGYKGGA